MDKKLRLSVILEALDRATGPMRGLQSQTDRTVKSFRAARDRLKDLNQAQKDVAAHRGLQEQLVSNTLALGNARRRADELGAAYRSADQPTQKLARQFSRARDEVQRLERAGEDHRQGLRQLENRLETAGVDTRRLATEEARLRQETQGATTELDQQRQALVRLGDQQRRADRARATYDRTRNMASNIQATGQSSVAAGVVVGASVVLPAREAMSLETAMADIRKVVDFETPEQFQQMRRDILDLTDAIPMANAEMAQIMAAAGQANVPREELTGFARDAAMMGVAFDTTADQAGSTMATWRTAFKIGQDGVRQLADQVNYLGNNTAAGVQAVTDIVTRVGPLGEVGGLASGEIAALGATMAAVGVETDRAGTGIQNLILGLAQGESATMRQRRAFKALGLDAGQMARDLQEDASGAILDVMQRLRELPEHARAGALSDLFGRESIGAIAPLLNNLDQLEGNLRMVGDEAAYAGSMQAEFDAVNGVTENGLTLTLNSLKNLGNEYGQQFLPQIQAVAAWTQRQAQALRAFAEEHPGVIRVVGGLLMALSGILIVFGALAMIVAAVLGPFALMRLSIMLTTPMFAPMAAGVWGAVRAFAAWGVTMLANPVTWIILGIIAAVALLAAGVYLVIRNWSGITSFFGGLWNSVTSLFSAGLALILNALMTFTPLGHFIRAFEAIWQWFPTVRERFLEFGGNLIRGIIDGVIGGIPALVGAVMNAGGRLINGFKQRLGIRSPSRIFAALGDETVAGLSQGLARSTPRAVRAVAQVGAGMAGALALGSTPAVAFTPGIGQQPPAAATGSAGGVTNNTFNIYAQPGQSPSDIVDEVIRRLGGDGGGGGEFGDDDYGE